MSTHINLDQTIHIIPDFAIVFSFYDHHTMGENMLHVYLEEISTKEIVTLRLDTPYDSGVCNISSFLPKEIDKIMEKALGNRLNNQPYHKNSRNAVCCCLNMTYPLTNDLLQKYNIKLMDENWKYDDLNKSFPNFVPSDKDLDYAHVKKDEEFGYDVIMDNFLSESESNRSIFSKWSDKKKALFGKFIQKLNIE